MLISANASLTSKDPFSIALGACPRRTPFAARSEGNVAAAFLAIFGAEREADRAARSLKNEPVSPATIAGDDVLADPGPVGWVASDEGERLRRGEPVPR